MAKAKEKEPKQANKGGGKRAVLRAAARARRKTQYAAQFLITEKNQRRRLTRHVRSHPEDVIAEKLHGKRVGATASLTLNSKGRKRAFIFEHGLVAWKAHRKAIHSAMVAA